MQLDAWLHVLVGGTLMGRGRGRRSQAGAASLRTHGCEGDAVQGRHRTVQRYRTPSAALLRAPSRCPRVACAGEGGGRRGPRGGSRPGAPAQCRRFLRASRSSSACSRWRLLREPPSSPSSASSRRGRRSRSLSLSLSLSRRLSSRRRPPSRSDSPRRDSSPSRRLRPSTQQPTAAGCSATRTPLPTRCSTTAGHQDCVTIQMRQG